MNKPVVMALVAVTMVMGTLIALPVFKIVNAQYGGGTGSEYRGTTTVG